MCPPLRWCQRKLLEAAYSGKFRRRKEILSCFPLFLPGKNAAFQEAVLALMRVAVVCVSSPWFPACHATPCGNLFLLPPGLSTQAAGFVFWDTSPSFVEAGNRPRCQLNSVARKLSTNTRTYTRILLWQVQAA